MSRGLPDSALAGDSVGARREIAAIEVEARTRYVDGFWPAIAHTALGDRTRAIAWLERALAARSSNIMTMNGNPELAPLRGDPGFESIARRAGLSAKGSDSSRMTPMSDRNETMR